MSRSPADGVFERTGSIYLITQHLVSHLAAVSWALTLFSPHIAPALVTLAFAAIAWRIHGVTRSGAIAGALITYVIYSEAGVGAFAAVVSVFLLAWGATRIGYERKHRMGTAERRDGRSASQVIANLGVAAAMALLYAFLPRPALLIAMAAALAEAAADTVSSEYGQAMQAQSRLITNWKQVPAGTEGGITWRGTGAGLVAGSLVAIVCAATHTIPWKGLPLAIIAAFVGTLADSYLGALFERPGGLSNDWVNFLSTAVAAGSAFVLANLML